MILSSWSQASIPRHLTPERHYQKWGLGQRDTNPFPVQSHYKLGGIIQGEKKQENNCHKNQSRYYL